jgi:hypothetical protein
MRLLVSLLVLACGLGWAQDYRVLTPAPGWELILRSLGLVPTAGDKARVIVGGEPREGAVVILEGHSATAEALGVKRGGKKLEVRQLRDVASPEMPIVWKNAETIEAAALSADWQVRAKDRWSDTPLVAVRRTGNGAVVWTATAIGDSGYERYPFLPQALLAAGLEPLARGRGLWAFFDAGYRQRVDQRYLVAQWKTAGIGAIHVTSWQFDEAPAEKAKWLEELIRICHENLIQVYAWVELPHVSEAFWQRYPQCREKTATGQDASLDWRRLMNLVDGECSRLAEDNILALLRRFEWDGVNLGELYFESLEGAGNPARFTPFHDAVRAEYKQLYGRDPLEDLKGEGLPRLLEYRANLAARLQSDWLARLAVLRDKRPHFDIVLTHIDDRFDTNMRDALGADAARVLRGTEGMGTGFLIEDPATVWHLGPARYREIRKRYEGLTAQPERLSIDLNIVDRYQDVYPTRRQTGAELAQLVHEAAASFDQVALYFEYSLRPVDLPLLGPAAARVEHYREEGGKLHISLGAPATVAWKGNARVNGMTWPLTDGARLLLPRGEWVIEPTSEQAETRLLDTNVRVEEVVREEATFRVRYSSRAAGKAVIQTATGTETLDLPGGKGELRLSAKPVAAGVESNSAQLLRQQ